MFIRIIFLSLISLTLLSCERIALMTTAKKQPIASQNQLSMIAEKKFWETLHAGNYAAIPETTSLLTAAYLENPNDPKLAAHLGFMHIWKITERAREKTIPPTITNEIILARKYFADAVELNPEDARFQGFLGDSMLVEGKIFHDEREQVRGYFQLQHAIAMWPEFNYFTAGYPMSVLDVQSKNFKEAVLWQWKTLDLCAGSSVDRHHPDFSPYLSRETSTPPLNACWNSWIAPHNFEGFFLNMGDMVVKQGDWQTGTQLYNNAKLSKTYSTWAYRKMLEERILMAKENVFRFRSASTNSANSKILFDSGAGCAVCHQK